MPSNSAYCMLLIKQLLAQVKMYLLFLHFISIFVMQRQATVSTQVGQHQLISCRPTSVVGINSIFTERIRPYAVREHVISA